MAVFEKYLTPNDVITKLSVPAAWLSILPDFGEGGQEVMLKTIDGLGFYWEFKCAIRTGHYKKPVLQSAGWLKYVYAKSLKVGDKIIFYEEVDNFRGTKYRFRAQKPDAYGNWVEV